MLTSTLLLTITIGLAALIFITCLIFYIVKNRHLYKWISADDFEKEKKKLRVHCTEQEIQDFISFLKSYGGGYVRRQYGKITYQNYNGKEKGDLKGIFFNIVFPNPNIDVSVKEDFRRYLNEIGVTGIEKRPDYETRDSKLKNKNKNNQDEYLRKEVGNAGEQIVRDTLDLLKASGYSVINGPILQYNNICKEFDHIVIGKNGVFCLETKAFGMTDGKSCKSSLFIDPGDKWIIRKNQTNRELESPTQQMISEKEHLQNIIGSVGYFNVHPVLVLCNPGLFVKNNIDLPYEVMKADSINQYIINYRDSVTDSEKRSILSEIDSHRVN